ncbi:YhbY family RNA-binding protein [Candidatus Woesearchaeota archaeon]|nr:YhbY family RNA-binding protein [Candidatus Woesearchaeota archaeon]
MALNRSQIRQLREKARALDPVVRIGKQGITAGIVTQVQKVLASRELVKVKFLRAFVEGNERKAAAGDLASLTGAELIDQVGFVAVLFRRNPEKSKTVQKGTVAKKTAEKKTNAGRRPKTSQYRR